MTEYYIKIRNWNKFQHFKDRRPPWIKLHKEILDQRDINVISDCSFRVLIGLWLLASEDPDLDGNLPCVADIAYRLRMTITNINKSLSELKPFLYHSDITVISELHQVDDPETETETETETEDSNKGQNKFDQFWDVYPKKVKRKRSLEIWKTKNINGKADVIIADVINRIDKHFPWKDGYTPHPTTYLNGELWNDEIQEVSTIKSKKKIIMPSKDDHTAIDKLGRDLGISPKGTEDYYQYRNRLIEAQKGDQT